MNFENTISKNKFITNYWEQKPIVFKNFLESAQTLIDPNDLILMAQDENYETRLIQFDKDWKVAEGPFEEKNIKDAKEWTLINHNIECNHPEVFKLKQSLSFLPLWLFDDVMTTLSNKGSSVGAHIDNYNVFILQLQGKREWKLQHSPNPAFIEDLEVKILKEFNADESIILEPGDMIYIPPHVAHHGVSLSDSLSISLGFKSLEHDKIISELALDSLEKEIPTTFYKTQFAKELKNTYSIDDSNKEKLICEIKEKYLDHFLDEAIKKFISAPKKDAEEDEELESSDIEENINMLSVYRDENLRFVFSENEVYINSQKYIFHSKEEKEYFEEVFSSSPFEQINKSQIVKYLKTSYQFFKAGYLYMSED